MFATQCYPISSFKTNQELRKRTPDNLFPNENELNPKSGWECAGLHQQSYGGGTTPVFHETVIPPWHPYLGTIWNGTCDAGQLTQEGLEDAIHHGSVSLGLILLTSELMFCFQDFWSVYHDKLGFLANVNTEDIHVRTTTEVRTHQVAGGILFGMDPATAEIPWPVYTQPGSVSGSSLVLSISVTLSYNVIRLIP